MNPLLQPVFWAVFTLLCAALLWLTLRRPGQWNSWVDKENDFWLARGIISARFAENIKRWEKGKPLKILTGLCALLGALLTAHLLLHSPSHRHLQIMLPPQPRPMQRQPANPRPRARNRGGDLGNNPMNQVRFPGRSL